MTRAPEIRIQVERGAIRIEQHRPSVARLLVGLEVSQALERVPKLLPICGHAQSIAAARAVAAAAGDEESHEGRRKHEARLVREQAKAAVWRLAVDWPDLLGESRDLAGLRAAQRATDAPELAAVVRRRLPGFDEADQGNRTEDVDAVLAWSSAADCPASRVIRRACELDRADEAPLRGRTIERLCGEALRRTAVKAFAAEPFDALEPHAGAIEVGPAAMARDPSIAFLDRRADIGFLTHRLLAQLLDVRCIVGALSNATQTSSDPSSWVLDEGVGLGSAMTARGPVFHRVALDRPGGRVEDWRILAPTDWHFAPDGPVARSAVGADRFLRFLVAGFDPCAPWTLTIRGQEDQTDA